MVIAVHRWGVQRAVGAVWFGPGVGSLGGGGRGRGGGSSVSQVSALDRASFNCCWRWGGALLKAKTRWGLVSPVVGVVMASYRLEGTIN